jgi:hypothetical protein
MIETKQVKKMDSNLESLKVDEFCGHKLIWVNPKSVNYHETVANNMRDGIGRGTKVYSPNGEEHIALLVDFDYDINNNLNRFIFVYFDKNHKREFTIDTNYQIGWTVVYDNNHYKL